MSAGPVNPEDFAQLRAALQKHESDLAELVQRAYKYLQSGQTQQALDRFKEALDEIEAYYGAWGEKLLLWAAFLGQAQWPDMRAKERADVLYGRGLAELWEGRLEDARKDLEEAVAFLGERPSPDRVLALQTLADVCQQQGVFREAAAHYEASFQAALTLHLWDLACMALSSLADCAYAQGDREGFLRHLDRAIALAEEQGEQGLPRERELHLKRYHFRMSADPSGATLQFIEQERKQLKRLAGDKGFQIDVLLLIANFWLERGEETSAEEALADAAKLAQELPEKYWPVLTAQSGLAERRGRLSEAVDYAERAWEVAMRFGFFGQVRQSLQNLIPLRVAVGGTAELERAEQEMEELRKYGRSESLALALVGRAQVFFNHGALEKALADIDEAIRSAPTREKLRMALVARTATLRAMDRAEEALEANLRALDVLREELESAPLVGWSDLLSASAVLHANAAVLKAKSGKVREAFELAEAGKAQVLRWQLAGSREALGSQLGLEASFAEIREMLVPESSALAMFRIGMRETLVIVLDPREQEPITFMVDLRRETLEELLPSGQLTPAWNDSVLKAIPELSAKLVPALTGVADHSKTLYLIPERRLYSVPFAALVLEDGSRLVDRCALAYAPSASILQWCRSRYRSDEERTR